MNELNSIGLSAATPVVLRRRSEDVPSSGSSPVAADDPAMLHKRSEILAAMRSNLEESEVDPSIRSRMIALLDELDLHLGLGTFHARKAALTAFAAAHTAILFPVLGPLIDSLGDHA